MLAGAGRNRSWQPLGRTNAETKQVRDTEAAWASRGSSQSHLRTRRPEEGTLPFLEMPCSASADSNLHTV